MHHTPTYASWLNQVERWFALLTDKKLRPGTHRSIQALENDIRDWIANWNDNPKPFTWTKAADEILNASTHIFNEFLAQDTKSIAQIARDLDINAGTLGNLVARDRGEGEGAQGLSTDDMTELKRLRSENAKLRMKRNILNRSVAGVIPSSR
jgi:hypothetical protein